MAKQPPLHRPRNCTQVFARMGWFRLAPSVSVAVSGAACTCRETRTRIKPSARPRVGRYVSAAVRIVKADAYQNGLHGSDPLHQECAGRQRKG